MLLLTSKAIMLMDSTGDHWISPLTVQSRAVLVGVVVSVAVAKLRCCLVFLALAQSGQNLRNGISKSA